MKNINMNEGIIQVPPELIRGAMDEILKVLFRYVYDLLPDREVYHLLEYNGEPLPIIDSSYRIIGLSERDQYNVIEIEYDTNIIPYTEQQRKATYGLIVTDSKKRKAKGAYSSANNILIITVDKNTIRDLQDAFFWMDEKYFSMSMEEKKDALDLMDTIREVDVAIKRFMRQLPATLEHELAHMIQYQYLKDKSAEQVKGDDGSIEGYYKSNVEFSPQIISALRDYQLYIQKVDKDNIKEYRSDVLKYLLVMSDKSVYYYDDYGTSMVPGEQSLFHELIEGNRAFFEILKNKKPKQYKRAVKYFINAL